MKKRPKLKGFTETQEDFSIAVSSGKILRMGVQIETPPCNWKCPYCYADDQPDQTHVKAAPVADMLSWITEGVELGAKGLTVNGTFEPTIGKHLFTVLEHSVNSGLNTMLVTNSSGLNEKNIQRIKALDIPVMIKLNVPIAISNEPRVEEYRKLQALMSGKPEHSRVYDRILQKLDMLIDAGFNELRTQGTDSVTALGVESAILKPNIKYLRLLSKQLRDRNIYSHFEVTKVQGSCVENTELVPNKEQLKKLFCEILEDDRRDGYEEFVPHPPYIAGTCYQNRIRINIAANGDVKPCPGVDVVLGNLTETPLKAIVANSPVLKKMRNLEKTIEGSCKNCEYMKAHECYGGCRGMAYQEAIKKGYPESKALVASDPSCWHVHTLLD
jgi:radical SAM protein with 4Fe4S-binding SPASM domain